MSSAEEEGRKCIPEMLTPKQVLALADWHIRHFEAARGPGWRPIEVAHYLAIWRNVKDKSGQRARLDASERAEIDDAFYCGDFDDLLERNK